MWMVARPLKDIGSEEQRGSNCSVSPVTDKHEQTRTDMGLDNETD